MDKGISSKETVGWYKLFSPDRPHVKLSIFPGKIISRLLHLFCEGFFFDLWGPYAMDALLQSDDQKRQMSCDSVLLNLKIAFWLHYWAHLHLVLYILIESIPHFVRNTHIESQELKFEPVEAKHRSRSSGASRWWREAKGEVSKLARSSCFKFMHMLRNPYIQEMINVPGRGMKL